MAKHAYSIGAFARLSGLSIKALRYYDAIGLLRPTMVDPSTRYRYYDARQLSSANFIVALRHAGLTLDEIALGQRGLDLARKRIARQLQDDRRKLARLDVIAESRDPEPIAVKNQPRMHVALLRETLTDYDDVDQLLRELLESVPLSARGVRVGARWANCLRGSAECTVFVELRDRTLQPRGRAVVESLAGSRTASLVVDGGTPDAFDRGYRLLHEWLARHGYAASGEKFEFYLGGPTVSSDTLTDVRFCF